VTTKAQAHIANKRSSLNSVHRWHITSSAVN